MAKGHEDTANYRYPVVLAQAEVGADPSDPARDAVARFHRNAARRIESGRPGLTASTTHDTKRSEDVRARLAVLSERAPEFEAGFRRWSRALDPPAGISAAELRFVAQTLLGTWPLDPDDRADLGSRLSDYLVKAMREAKQATSWLTPDDAHEAAVVRLATRSLADDGRLLLDAFGGLVDDVAWYGAINGLAQLTWKLALPGTADFYRGTELWDLSLVDPDNRRPVDFARRITMLRDQDDDWRTGGIKLRMTFAGLHARRAHPELFTSGAYFPIGVADDAALAFARTAPGSWAIACAPRLATRLAAREHWPVGRAVWGDRALELPPGAPAQWRDVYTGATVEARAGVLYVGDVLTRLPAALLVSI
jgi:(1->4)-alpha-D-glucan 1-alpha-D-glucosylmutase